MIANVVPLHSRQRNVSYLKNTFLSLKLLQSPEEPRYVFQMNPTTRNTLAHDGPNGIS